MIVHTFFLTSQIGPGSLINQYAAWSAADSNNAKQGLDLSELVVSTLRYIIMSSVAGGLLGWVLGIAVARNKVPLFIKHRWMIELLGADKGNVVFATVLTAPKYATGKDSGDFAVLIQGYIRDCFFAPDGKLHYLAFRSSKATLVKLGDEALNVFSGAAGKPPGKPGNADNSAGSPLLLEGNNVLMVRYERLPAGGVSSEADIQELEQAVAEADKSGETSTS